MAKKASKPVVSAEMSAACRAMHEAMTPLLDSILAVTDKFQDDVVGVGQPEWHGGMELLKGIRDAWNLMSWFMDEAVRITNYAEKSDGTDGRVVEHVEPDGSIRVGDLMDG